MTRPDPFLPKSVPTRALRAVAAALVLAPPAALAGVQVDTTAAADTVFAVEPLVVTASRLPRGAGAPGLAVRTMALSTSGSAWAADQISGLAGAFLDAAAGPGGPTIVRLRGGEEVFTQILFDGVPVNQNGGFFDFMGLALSNLDRVDVARGPQSAVHGSSAVSGVVQFHTPRGPVGGPRWSLRAEGGDAVEAGGEWRTSAAVGGGTERFRYSAGLGAAFRRGIYVLPHDTRTRDASLRLDWAPAPRWEAILVGRRVDVASQLPVRDPGATRVPLDPNARSDRDRTVGSLTVRHTPSAAWSVYARAHRYREDFLYVDERDGVTAPPDAGFFVFDADLQFRDDLHRAGVETGASLEVGSLRATAGVSLEREELDETIEGDFASPPLFLERSSVAGFGEAAWRFHPRATVGVGLRVESYEELEAEVSPRASVAVEASDGVTFRAVMGRAFKAPNLQQQYVDNPFIVANPDLRPERSTSVEAGVDVEPTSAAVRLGLTVFRQTYEDLIRTVGQEGDSRQINRNLGAARAVGVEWNAAARLGGPVWLETEGAWVRTEIQDNTGLAPGEFPRGEALPGRPSVVAGLALAFRGAGVTGAAERGTRARLSARRVGAQTVLTERFSGARVRLGGYTLVGLDASTEVAPGARLFVRLENLFDTRYATAFDRPGLPATGSVGIDLRF